MSFEIDRANGSVKKMAYSKERSEGGTAATPLNMSINLLVSGGILRTLLMANTTPPFWRDGGNKELMFPTSGKAACSSQYQYCQVDISGVHLKDCKLINFSYTPKPGAMVELDFNCLAKEVSAKDMAKLLDNFKGPVCFTITGGDLVTQAENYEEEGSEEESEEGDANNQLKIED